MKWMTFSWKIGYIRGVEIRLHFSVLLSLIITYLVFHPTNLRSGLLASLWLLGFLFSIFMHELGHALAAKLVHAEVKSIVIWLLGGFTALDREPQKPLHRFAIYIAGPAVTFFFAVFFAAIFFTMSVSSATLFILPYFRLSLSLAVLNTVLLIFNILPVYPLDGGRILQALSEYFFGRSRANLITMMISIPVLIGLIVFGIRTHDYILLGFCLLIALAISTLNRHSLRWVNLGLNYLLKRGGYYFMQADYERAANCYGRDIERHPKQVNNYLARALCYVWMSRPNQAIADLERALQIDPKNPMALLLHADLYAMDKNYDAALELISKGQEINPNWGAPYIDRGAILLRKQEFASALEEFNKGIALISQVPLFYIDRSMVHFRLGDLEAAHKDQDTAFELSEKDATTRPEFNLQAYEDFLDWAEDYYARMLAKRPDSWRAYQGRADAYRANNEQEKAIVDYTRAIEINPKEPSLYLGRGKCYQAIEDLNCAATDFRQVLAVTPKAHLRRQATEHLKALEGQ
jgi:tetratricopeptide (TPR) repeat protein